MKRTLYILLILVLLLPLCACGGEGDNKYSYLPPEHPYYYIGLVHYGQPVKGGAYIMANFSDIKGEVTYGTITLMSCIFDEETKSVIPLCMDATCSHEDECFGGYYGIHPRGLCGFYKDSLFMIYSKNSKGTFTKGDVGFEITFYSLDGTETEKIPFTDKLTRLDGTEAVSPCPAPRRIWYGHRLYFTVFDGAEAFIDPNASSYSHWLVSFDFETKEFTTHALFPAANDQTVDFTDMEGSNLSFDEADVGYVLNIDTGELTQFDCASVLDRLVEDGKLPPGGRISRIYPLDGIFTVSVTVEGSDGDYQEYYECSVSGDTVEKVEDIYQHGFGQAQSVVTYMDKTYLSARMSYDRSVLGYRSTDLEHEFSLDPEEYSLSVVSETENGIIFSYLLRNPDGTLEPQQEVKTVDGKTVTEFKPRKLMYVTKADVVDGSIDEPWFYDPETYTFVRQ